MKNLALIVLIALVFVGCKKRKARLGDYVGTETQITETVGVANDTLVYDQTFNVDFSNNHYVFTNTVNALSGNWLVPKADLADDSAYIRHGGLDGWSIDVKIEGDSLWTTWIDWYDNTTVTRTFVGKK